MNQGDRSDLVSEDLIERPARARPWFERAGVPVKTSPKGSDFILIPSWAETIDQAIMRGSLAQEALKLAASNAEHRAAMLTIVSSHGFTDEAIETYLVEVGWHV